MNTSSDWEEQILQFVNRDSYRPIKPRAIAKKLEVPDELRRDFRRTVKQLVRKGKLRYGPSHVVFPINAAENSSKPSRSENRPAPTHRKYLHGIFHRASAGYGFVRPSGTPASSGRSEDIFIPLKKTADAADGDLVEVRIRKRRRREDDPRKSGEIVDILERGKNRFVGVYREEVGGGFVRVDGAVFADPIYVGDAGAKNVQAGDIVVIEMVRFPSHFQGGEAVVVEVLGPRGAPGVDTLTILREYNLPGEFPEAALAEARSQAEQFDESLGDRRDLTSETTITIDPEDARDFDDAISLDRLENGHWRLGVHIADVAHFVRAGSPLDDEARDRATSIYLPDKVIPMLPEIVSNHLASLQPNHVRYTRTVFIEYTADGAVVDIEICRSAIKSRRRFSYEEVDQYLANRKPWRKKLEPAVFDLLGRMHELAMILRRRRLLRGAIELALPDIKIDLDKNGEVCGAHTVEHTESHQIIEEFMLAANEAVAETLQRLDILFLRRVHAPPDPRKLMTLTRFVRELGFECESLESRFEIKRVIHEASLRPEGHAVNYAVLRSMQKAVYSPDEEGHYALASDSYCHFTSPIRRYPDLTVHRLFDLLDSDRRPPSDFDRLTLLGDHCSEREQRAETAERELIKVKLLNYLGGRIGSQMQAVITRVEDYGFFAQGVELPAEGLVHVNSLIDDHYYYESANHSLSGHRKDNRYRLGDVVLVEVAHVDVDRRELDFRVVRRLKSAAPAKTKAKKAKKAKPRKTSNRTVKRKAGAKKTTSPRRRKR